MGIFGFMSFPIKLPRGATHMISLSVLIMGYLPRKSVTFSSPETIYSELTPQDSDRLSHKTGQDDRRCGLTPST
jgi:hypothetical protein